ncbi:MAG: IPT/TIG domain-containing protein, partial [Myxococcales bacterium]|nr:IPT/TIG domain-containing protein [Myxococcales bacterium]
MSRRTASWACLLGLFATSCDLWSAYRSADPKNCVLSPNLCSTREFCSIETERCQSSDSDPAGLRLDSISPPTGPNAGEIVVSLIGSGLATVQQVTFDGRDAMILGSDGKTLQVRLPAHPGKTGYVPVVVRSAAGQIQRDTLFSYHNGSLSFGAGTTGSATIPLPNPLHSFDVAD